MTYSKWHGIDARPVKRKQNCALSEKGALIICKIIKDAGNKKKKQMEKKQRRAQDYCKIQMAESQKICHKDYITDLEAPLENPSTTINDGTKPSTQTSLMEKRTV